jgi:hypothetical protein
MGSPIACPVSSWVVIAKLGLGASRRLYGGDAARR